MKNDAGRNRWVVVLSGGDGQRMDPFIRRWLGHSRPKQYCAFAGGRTMLEHTYDRALAAAPAERVVTIVNADHRPFLEGPRRLKIPGRLIAQPLRRDTGPGVYLPLAFVLSRDPDALVALMPSDHFIRPLDRFADLLDRAYRLAAALAGRLVLLSARPDRPEPEYGWITTGRTAAAGAMVVERFQEKPAPEQAAALHRGGALWNTMIVVARARTFWRLAHEHQPEMMSRFENLPSAMGRPHEGRAVARAYAELDCVNFSRGILERAARRCVTLPMDRVQWSDWGRPGRIRDTLAGLGKGRDFPAEEAVSAERA